MAHTMLDLETLGLTAGSVILSIGAVAFDPVAGTLGETFYRNIDRASCEAVGLTADPATEAWWAKQSPEVRAALEADQVELGQALFEFAGFYELRGGALWSQGPSFDPILLAAAFEACGQPVPWAYDAPRDTRTVYELSGLTPDRKRATLHNALEDAKAQAAAVHDGYVRLGLTEAAPESPSRHLPDEINALPVDRLREEVWAWRQDAAARIQGMMASAKASDERGEEDRAIDIRVNFLSPSAVALSNYIAGEYHEACEDCGKPLLHGQQVWPVEDANDVHASCWPGPIVQDGVEIQAYTYSDFYTPASVAAVAAGALAYCHDALGLEDDVVEAAQ